MRQLLQDGRTESYNNVGDSHVTVFKIFTGWLTESNYFK